MGHSIEAVNLVLPAKSSDPGPFRHRQLEETGAQNMLSKFLWYDLALSWSARVIELALELKRKEIDEAKSRLLRIVGVESTICLDVGQAVISN